MNTPMIQFKQWYDSAQIPELPDTNRMVLSTVSKEGKPSSRVVLLKRYIEDEIYFFTNYNSRKAQEIGESSLVSLLFHWYEPSHRQIRIEGTIRKADPSVSEEYYNSRPRGSRIGAWSSPQSEVIADREQLEKLVKETESRYEGQEDIPCPPHWGGYAITPKLVEFWQEGEFRLHHRERYCLEDNGKWAKELLAP